MKGPGLRMTCDVRRLWHCPRCDRVKKTQIDATSCRCICHPDAWMKVVDRAPPIPPYPFTEQERECLIFRPIDQRGGDQRGGDRGYGDGSGYSGDGSDHRSRDRDARGPRDRGPRNDQPADQTGQPVVQASNAADVPLEQPAPTSSPNAGLAATQPAEVVAVSNLVSEPTPQPEAPDEAAFGEGLE